MAAFPSRTRLYRREVWAVIYYALVIFSVARVAYPQFAQRSTVSKGPRAVGLLELRPNGTADLVPICMMIDGHFYDASIYKAVPVPMALERGTVYEAERTGTSLGLFTVKGALERMGSWIGQGTFEPTGAKHPQPILKAEVKPREEDDKPPLLRHPGSQPPKTESKPEETKPARPPSGNTPTQVPNRTTGPAEDNQDVSPDQNDPNRPRLRRGAPSEAQPSQSAHQGSRNTSPAYMTGAPAASASPAQIQLLPAVSDAGGPDPRPYTYGLKSDEEQVFRKAIMALAADELLKAANEIEPDLVRSHAIPAGNGRSSAHAKARAPQPTFHDVNLRAFDVATSNEPILVLTAKGQLPEQLGRSAGDHSPPDFYVALVAHSDLYGKLRSLFSAITDSQHLDVSPRLDFIDVVDADGDGRGELLFRKTSDQGSAYAIYRVGADKLWPLYEGKPSEQ